MKRIEIMELSIEEFKAIEEVMKKENVDDFERNILVTDILFNASIDEVMYMATPKILDGYYNTGDWAYEPVIGDEENELRTKYSLNDDFSIFIPSTFLNSLKEKFYGKITEIVESED